jgi:hypothetical protein
MAKPKNKTIDDAIALLSSHRSKISDQSIQSWSNLLTDSGSIVPLPVSINYAGVNGKSNAKILREKRSELLDYVCSCIESYAKDRGTHPSVLRTYVGIARSGYIDGYLLPDQICHVAEHAFVHEINFYLPRD